MLLLTLPTVARAQFSYTIEDGGVTITRYAGLDGIVAIPDTIDGLPVTAIADHVFWRYSYPTLIAIPASVTNIAASAFASCTGLFDITVDALNPVYRSVDGVLFNRDQTIILTFPEGRTGNYSIPEGVTRIGHRAFAGSNLSSVAIPESVTDIGSSAFWSCTSLTQIAIPDSVTTLGEGAFSRCTRLETAVLGEGVTGIEDSTFYSCYSLTGITIPSSVITIGEWAFLYCYALTSVTIPESVTSIGDRAFEGCGITSIVILNGVSSLGYRVFSECHRLTSIAIPNSVIHISPYSFMNCRGLTNIVLASGVSSIGDYAFSHCRSLTQVQCLGNSPVTGLDVFSEADAVRVYYLPGTTGWGPTYAGRPTAWWVLSHPVVLTSAPDFGIQNNVFGFRISWATNASVVVDAATDPSNPTWSSLSTNALADGWSYFSDPDWANHPTRFYRVRSR